MEQFCHFLKKGIFDLSPRYYVDSGIPLIRTTEIKSEIADMSSVVFLSEETHGRHRETELERADIVFTKIGANIGDSAILPRRHRRYNFSQNVAGAKIRKGVIAPHYLAAYLNSKFGRLQLRRAEMPSGQGKLELTDIKRILIVVADCRLQRCVEGFYLHAEDEIQKSSQLYSQAENLLLEELGLKDFMPKYELSYSANLSKAFGAHRVDAEYFQPSCESLVGKLTETVEVKPLKYFLVDIKKGIEVGREQYQEEGKLFIRVSNLSIDGLIERDQKYIDETLYAKLAGQYEPKVGELLLTKDATPGVAYVLKEPIGAIMAGGVLRLTVDEARINGEYLALCINSLIGKLQVERDGAGSVIKHWRPEQVKRLLVPVLRDEIQQQIESLVRQSHDARRKARHLLGEAKRRVEEMIEGASVSGTQQVAEH